MVRGLGALFPRPFSLLLRDQSAPTPRPSGALCEIRERDQAKGRAKGRARLGSTITLPSKGKGLGRER